MSDVPAWAEGLPDEIRESEAIQKIPDIETAAKRIVDLDAKQDEYRGKLSSAIAVPASDAPEAEWNEFYERAGKHGLTTEDPVPDKPDGYEFNGELEGLGEDYVKDLAAELHAQGYGKRIAAKIAKERGEKMRSAMEANDQAKEQVFAAMREKYGNDMQAALENSDKVADALGIGDIMETPLFKADGTPVVLGTNKELVMALAKMYGAGGEDSTTGGDGGGQDTGPTLQELTDERTAIDVKFGQLLRDDPGSAELRVLRRERMMLSGKIAAKKAGVPFQNATPEQIADAVIPE